MAIVRLFLSLSFLAVLTHAQSPEAEVEAARLLGATHVAPVFFDPGIKALNPDEKEELRNFVGKIQKNETIETVKVLVWADREYPKENEKASSKQIELAKVRSQMIREYLQSDLKLSQVEVHNMAQRPSTLSEVLHTKDYEVKSKAEAVGAAPKKEEIGFFEEMGRSTTALVLFVVKEKTVSQLDK